MVTGHLGQNGIHVPRLVVVAIKHVQGLAQIPHLQTMEGTAETKILKHKLVTTNFAP